MKKIEIQKNNFINKFYFCPNYFSLASYQILKNYAILILFKSESVKFSLIESVICVFTDESVKKYFSLSNQSIFTEIISEI